MCILDWAAAEFTAMAAANAAVRTFITCRYSRWTCDLLALVLLIFPASLAASGSVVTTLPGFTGNLPFKLETGYIGVGELEEVQLFYYFVESQRTPSEDPLMLWLAGGPGCSGLSSLIFESGPLSVNYEEYNGSLPTLHLNTYAWTQGLNIIYIDAPVGTGFSYSTTSEGYYSSDRKAVVQLYEFLRKWLMGHPDFLTNQVYIGGESYSGLLVPMLVQEIINGIEAGNQPLINIQGYVLGNPVTDSNFDDNSRIPTAYGFRLISHELYKSAKSSCKGDYVNVDSNNTQCELDISAIDELLREINLLNILEPSCSSASLEVSKMEMNHRSLEEKSSKFPLSEPRYSAFWCRDYNYVPLAIWANERDVQEALNVRMGTKEFWKSCNESIAYTKEISTVVECHRNLSETGLRALIYSGDHDLSVPSLGTQEWISSLNMTLDDSWRAWSMDGQTVGYTKKYANDDFTFTYATIKGAGHIAPEYKLEECYTMIDRWLARYPL